MSFARASNADAVKICKERKEWVLNEYQVGYKCIQMWDEVNGDNFNTWVNMG